MVLLYIVWTVDNYHFLLSEFIQTVIIIQVYHSFHKRSNKSHTYLESSNVSKSTFTPFDGKLGVSCMKVQAFRLWLKHRFVPFS